MPTRRHFLHTALGFAALPHVAGAAAPGGVSLGFSLYGMKTLSLSEALKTCAEIGYANVEFALNAGFPTEPKVFTAEARKEAAQQLSTLKLDLPCLMVNLSLAADDKAHAQALQSITDAAQLARELNAAQPAIIETVLGGKPATWEQQKSGMAERLQSWAETAEKAQTTIAIKAHVGSAVNSPERLLWLLEQVKSPAIQVAYDYSHFELQGIGMEESMKLLLTRTKFIHVKDSTGDPSKFQFLLPGEGRTDYVKYFTALKQHGYHGPVVVEVSGQIFNKPGYEPIAAAKQCYAVLAGALAKVV
ncbi:MAG: sugar phosphate isomerase/epimerase family protein [Prosthecobacter sp.]|uniref:sugar phosphate isomerase/epimerase family protein n=1 Tax=Prosthecobacter sp. TaxID=1965333 RepID=UPI0038FEE47A